VWTANRDNPITTPSSPILTITNSFDLVLSDSEGRNIWMTTSNITAGSVGGGAGAGAYAVLLNSGNFVLRSPNGRDIWQSFDHPTDTLLPTMRFLVSYKAKVVGRLVAWKGQDDPSSGDFSCSGDPSSPTRDPSAVNFAWDHAILPQQRLERGVRVWWHIPKQHQLHCV
jgi:hypothetical protein